MLKKINGLCYGPFRDGQSPITKIYPSLKEVKDDIKLFKKILKKNALVKTFSTTDILNEIPKLLKQNDLRSLPTCSLDRGRWISVKEFHQLIDIANKGLVRQIVVGDMVLTRNILSYRELLTYIKKAKTKTNAQVSTSNHWQIWLKYPKLVKEIDFISVGIYPHKKKIPFNKALNFVDEVTKKIQAINPEKKTIIIDSGWPVAEYGSQKATYNRENQVQYINDFTGYCEKNKLQYIIFEAFDENWKKIYEKDFSTRLGIFTADRKMKEN